MDASGLVTKPQPVFLGRKSATASLVSLNEIQDKHDIMVKYLHKKCVQSKWLEPSEEDLDLADRGFSTLGVALRRQDRSLATEPRQLSNAFVQAVERLEVPVAFTMSSEISQSLIQQLSPYQRFVPLGDSGLTLPIVNSLKDLGVMVSRASYACVCLEERIIVLWTDNPQGILAHGSDIESLLVGAVWGSPITTPGRGSVVGVPPPPFGPTNSPLRAEFHINTDPEYNEKMGVIQNAIEREVLGDQLFDPEKDGMEPPKRPFLLVHALSVAVAFILVVVVEMACVAKLTTEALLDGDKKRFALLATIPLFAFFSLFFMIVVTGSLLQLFGPLTSVHGNSIYFSAKAPKAGRYRDLELPHITIQMPVYKEGLKGVIIPTISSVQAAIKHYEAQGGTASIYVNDDGMQLVTQDLAEARMAYYEINHVGWCSRPKHCLKEGPDYFVRKGKFKKASNMNYCLDFSLRVEAELAILIDQTCQQRACISEDLTVGEENDLYKQALDSILERDGGKTLSAGNVRLGEIILIIDSDTRVPEDCLLYGALEMHESPEVALLQHSSGILQVANNVFENGATYFTNLVYTSIQFAVGNGDCAPFVGHNTFMRWRAIQSIAWEEDGKYKFWSESHVSEDFDISLRLQMNDFIVRLATYHNGGFKEGVSLTVYDELGRWEKYAYGCNELVFHPLIRWPTHGPLTPLFRRFLFSNIKVTSKVTILAYIGTYYAIASALPLTLANYLIVGWFGDNVDQFYIASWKIFVGMVAVFNILSPLGYAMLRHRLGQKTFFISLAETIKWTPFFLLFFGGLSFHLLKALGCHFFSVNMEWTATAKELEANSIRVGLDRIVRDFKGMYLAMIPLAAMLIYLAQYAPRGFLITDFTAIVPLANQVGCHTLLPFALGLA